MLLILPDAARFNPVITDLLIALYTDLKQDVKAVKVLDEAISFHKASGAAGGEKLVQMLRRSAKYKQDSGDARAAAKVLEEIHKKQVIFLLYFFKLIYQRVSNFLPFFKNLFKIYV